MAKVNTQHKDFQGLVTKWQRCRDAVAGQDAIHAAGELYLPRLKDQKIEDYNAYKLRAQYFNAVWRTISALAGMIFRKPPVIETPASIEPLLEDMTMSGINFYVLAQRATLEVLTTGRVGILVDYPAQFVNGMTIADAQKQNLRPIMQIYPAETIINWKTGRVGNKNVLKMVVLSEDADISVDSEFEHKIETHYRVLDLLNGQYRVRVFRINGRDEDEQISEDLFPIMNNKSLDFIPFYFLGIDDTTPETDDPPLIDLINVNLAHYRTCADYAHGLHFTGLPTAVISGYTPEDPTEKLYIGSSSAWVFPDPQASAKFLEFTGQGLGALEKAIERMEQQMAILGARLLSSEKKDTETAQTAQIHRAGESSILASISATISIGLTKALQTFCAWAGVPDDEAMIELNKEFMRPDITPQELAALVSAWQVGAISMQVLFDRLQKTEVIENDLDLETMQEQIRSAPYPRPANIE